MVNDLLETTLRNLQGVNSIEAVRGASGPMATFSPEMATRERRLKAFMYERLYHHEDQLRTAGLAKDVIAQLYAAYEQKPDLMPRDWSESLPGEEPERGRHVADFIAGMTDRYAIRQFQEIFGSVPEGLSNV